MENTHTTSEQTTEESRHERNRKAREHYAANKDRILSRQKAQKALQRQTSPWVHTYRNDKAAAKSRGFLGQINDRDGLALYQRAYNMGRRVRMIVGYAQGGKFEYGNMEIV